MKPSTILHRLALAAAGMAAAPALAQQPTPPAAPTPASADAGAPVTTNPTPAPAPAEAPASAAAPAAEAPPPPPVPIVPPPAPIAAAKLQAPDLFSAAAGPATGLPADLWRGTSADLARTALPLIAQKPLSPAAADFAHRLAATGARAPDGAGADADLAAARIDVVLSTGDIAGAQAMLAHTAGVSASPALSQVAAEADLVLGQEDLACKVGDGLTQGKDGPYWRRLRAYCLVAAGNTEAAQLAYDLAESQAKDDIYKRLMSAAVSATPPGAASLRNGLDFALSKRLNLDLTSAIAGAWTPILKVLSTNAAYPDPIRAAAAAKLKAVGPGDPPTIAAPVLIPLEAGDAKSAAAARAQMAPNDTTGATGLELALLDTAIRLADGRNDQVVLDQLVALGGAGDPKDRAKAQGAAALYAAAGAPMGGSARAGFAAFDLGPAPGSQARLLEMDMASAPPGARGDAALLALWLAADAGPSGPPPAERAQIVGALNRAGFAKDARALALEGVIAILTPPPEPVAKPAPAPKAAKAPAKAPPKRRAKR